MRAALAVSLLLHAGAAVLVFLAIEQPRPAIEISSIEVVAVPARAKTVSMSRKVPTPGKISARSQSAAPVQASVVVNSSATASYLAQIRDKLSGEIRPPRVPGNFALRPALEMTLEMTLSRDGRIRSSRIMQSSGSPEFDRSVAEALQRALPFPPFTAEMGAVPEVTLRLPVKIRFRRF